MNILLIEDERSLSDVLMALFRREHYHVDAAYDGESGQDFAISGIYDLIILDIMLPKKDGLAVLKTLRSRQLHTPVLLLTAKSEVHDKIAGLDHGADDYITKPFDTGELLARIRAMTRRQGELLGEEIMRQDTVLNTRTLSLSSHGKSVKLGAKELYILELLMKNWKQVIPKERLAERVWGFESDVEYNAVEVYISFLRKKLAAVHSGMQIKAIRGIGYVLEEKE